MLSNKHNVYIRPICTQIVILFCKIIHVIILCTYYIIIIIINFKYYKMKIIGCLHLWGMCSGYIMMCVIMYINIEI